MGNEIVFNSIPTLSAQCFLFFFFLLFLFAWLKNLSQFA